MDDPLYTVDFIKDIIQARHNDIVGLTIAKGGRLKVGGKRSKFLYIIALLIIMSVPMFFKNVMKTLIYRLISKIKPNSKRTLAGFCKTHNIPVTYTNNPNSKVFLNLLQESTPDIIINQSQFIIKKKLLSIPKIGVLNRHNALLPKNRGRLTPFWVLYHEEKETGVSIHYVDKGIDSGPIVVQKRFTVEDCDTFNTVVKKNYEVASKAMLEALDKIESGDYRTYPNSDENATYNTIPTLREAVSYRWRVISAKRR